MRFVAASLLVVALIVGYHGSALATSFGTATNYTTAAGPRSLITGDFNADSKQDIITTNSGGTVSVLLGNGDGTFASHVDYAVGSAPKGMASADFNGDGKADIAVANVSSGNVSVLLGVGDGTFGSAVNYATGAMTAAAYVTAADFDGDSKQDLAVTDQTANKVFIFTGDGTGAFTWSASYATGAFPQGIKAADFTGDGKADLAVAVDTGNTLTVFINNGDGTFASAVTYSAGTNPELVSVGDFNEDGVKDLAVANFVSADVSIFIGNGDGTFDPAVNYSTATGAHGTAIADWNADGHQDVAVVNAGATNLTVRSGVGDGTFGSGTNFTVGNVPQDIAAADFNGDTKPDIAVVNQSDNNVSVLLNMTVGALDHFVFDAIPAQTVASGFTVTVTAKDVGGLTVTGFTGTVDFTSTIGTVTPATSPSFSAGVLTTTISLASAGTGTVTATDHAGTGRTGTSTSFTVYPAATVSSVTSSLANGSYGTGQVVPIEIVFNTPVTVSGIPVLYLNTTPTATAFYSTGSTLSTLTFLYTVLAGDTSPDLDYATSNSLSLAGGTIHNAAGTPATLTLPMTGGFGLLAGTKDIVIDTQAPVLAEVTPVDALVLSSTAQYTFSSSEDGTITYGGSCGTATTTAVSGDNTVTFSGLANATYSDCTITVTDAAGNASAPLTVNTFRVSAHRNNGGGGGGGGGIPPNDFPLCQDPAAVNYRSIGVCIYPAQLCQDHNANNYGTPLPCTYDQNVPPPDLLCQDRHAENFGGNLPCRYPDPVEIPSMCQDPRADNVGGPLPCSYPKNCAGAGCVPKPDTGGGHDSGGTPPAPTGGSSGGSSGGESPTVPAPTKPSSGGGCPPITATSTAGVILQEIRQSYCDTVLAAKEAYLKIRALLAVPRIGLTQKIVTIAALVASAAATIATALFLNPLSFSEIVLIPARLWSLLMTAFGLKKRRRPWGTVYDSVTKQPLDPAYVMLRSVDGKDVASTLTDLDGRFGFVVPEAGTYALVAQKTNYVFPSQRLVGQDHDELYRDLYFGEYFTVAAPGEIVIRNIPMDSAQFDWNEFAKKEQHLMRFYSSRTKWLFRISNVLFGFGFTVAALATIVAPRGYNIAILALYVLLFFVRRHGLAARPFGYVSSRETGKPLSFAIVRVSQKDTGVELMHRIADATGRYYCLLPNGEYHVRIDRKLADGTYEKVIENITATVKKGYLAETFEV